MEVTRIFDLLQYSKQHFDLPDALAAKENGEWRTYSIDNYIAETNRLSFALHHYGIRKNDKVAIMSSNRPEWNFADMAITQLGAVQVPLYPTLSETDLEFIIRDADIKFFFVQTKELHDKIAKVLNSISSKTDITVFDRADGTLWWNDFSRSAGEPDLALLDSCKASVSPDDLLTLIYTSGTTGDPKGVMLSHSNLGSNLKSCTSLVPPGTAKALSFLPLSHVFERMVNYLYLFSGIAVYYAENMDTIVANLNEVHPHIFTTVPRLLEKVYDRIVSRGQEQKGVKKQVFFWALKLGLKYEPEGKNGLFYESLLGVASKLVFSKWREALGGNMLAIVSGGAALQPRLSRVFSAAGITIMEGYGLTETSPVIAVNTTAKGHLRFGTVGKVISGDTVKIAEDGEILVKGPNIMVGYYKHPDKTAQVIDSEGFFCTGDIGEVDKDGFLKITDRKKEVFKTSGGKYVAPGVLENKFKESPFIEQIMVIGEGERFPSALIVPTFEHLRSWARIKEIPAGTNEELVHNIQVLEKYQHEIDEYNLPFGHWMQVKKFVLLPCEWSIDRGELTPKLSVKRKVVMEKYKRQIEGIYA